MPHKRAKASVRKARKSEVDLPVGKETPLDADTPKGFSRLFRFKEMATKKRQEKKETKLNQKDEKKEKLTIQPGEKMKDFVYRVDQTYRDDMLSSQKEAKTKSDRKKRNQETRKQKKLAKKQKELDLFGGRDFDDLEDKVKFGEVVDAPPTLNKVPKARGRGKETLETKTKEAVQQKKESGYESEEDENMKLLKASHKRKLQNMSAAAKIQLDLERDRAIETYRAKKQKRLAEAGV
ncbi:hypothetical protein K501DRAFT_263850 [Backusella circina FSU 941]|nr:hypothetical protein K501DRAFT_263850 [Backusella circina FSU 941]